MHVPYGLLTWILTETPELTDSIEKVKKRALKCIYPCNEYADILFLTNLPCLKESCWYART